MGFFSLESCDKQQEVKRFTPMTSQETVYKFLKGNPNKGFCDQCLASATSLNVAEVSMATATMSLFPHEFRRLKKATCSNCRVEGRVVTQWNVT